jgi:hypothetical protein
MVLSIQEKKQKKSDYNKRYRLKQLEKLKDITEKDEKKEDNNFFFKIKDTIINQSTMILIPVVVKLMLSYCLKKSSPQSVENTTNSNIIFS